MKTNKCLTTAMVSYNPWIVLVLPDNRGGKIVSRIVQVEEKGEQFWGGGNAYPNTYQLLDKPGGNKQPNPRWDKEWIAAHVALNQQNSDDAVDKLFFPSTGILNPLPGQEEDDRIDWRNMDELPDDVYVRPESILTPGFYPVDEIYGTRDNPKAVYISTYKPSDKPPDPERINYKTAALGGCVNVMAIHRNEHFSLIGSGTDGPDTNIYYYPMTPTGGGWLDYESRYADQSFAFMPDTPFYVTVRAVRGLTVRLTPERNTDLEPMRALRYGRGAWIVRLFPSYDGLWGELDSGGWVCLVYLPYPGRAIGYMYQYTSFRLPDVALMPIRPAHDIPGSLPVVRGTYGGVTNQDVINAVFATYDIHKLALERDGLYIGDELPEDVVGWLKARGKI
jgi:hypothetical protein